MKLLRCGERGHEVPAVLASDGTLRALSSVLDDITPASLGDPMLAALAAIDPLGLPQIAPSLRIGVPVRGIGKIVAIGLNYADHAREAGAKVPDEPILFLKATSSLSGPDDDVVTPRGSTKLDWEIELAVVIGTTARYVAEAEAMAHVAGYCLANDVSERTFQLERAGTWDKGKGCDSFGPLGPWLVTRDEIPDPQRLGLSLAVNGTVMQQGTTADMIAGVARLIALTSSYMTLLPGDVILTGTPAGVGLGKKPTPIFLAPGDVMRLSIDGLGTQTQRVVGAD